MEAEGGFETVVHTEDFSEIAQAKGAFLRHVIQKLIQLLDDSKANARFLGESIEQRENACKCMQTRDAWLVHASRD